MIMATGSMAALRDERLAILRSLMAHEGLDALVAVAGSGIDERRAVRFATNYFSLYRPSATIVWPERLPTLIVIYRLFVERAKHLAWTDDIRLAADFEAGVVEALAAAGRLRRVGVIGGALMTARITEAVRAITDEVVDIERQFEVACRIKTLEDRVLARRLGPLIAAGWQAVAKAVSAGATEREVVGEGQLALSREGAEASAFLISSDGRLPDPWPRGRQVRRSDVVQLSLEVAAPGGLWAQSARTFCAGQLPDWSVDLWHAVTQVLEWMATALRPGAAVSSLADEARARLEALGGKNAMPLGHGLGLNVGESPAISVDDPTVLAPGMMLAVHPNVQVADGGIFMGDSFLITDEGAERLGPIPQSLSPSLAPRGS